MDAARAAGAEVLEGYRVEDVVFGHDRVVGIRGHEKGGTPATETAGGRCRRQALDGPDAVGARRYRQRPASTLVSYTYWSGVAMSGGELYRRPSRAVAAFPTNDDLTMI